MKNVGINWGAAVEYSCKSACVSPACAFFNYKLGQSLHYKHPVLTQAFYTSVCNLLSFGKANKNAYAHNAQALLQLLFFIYLYILIKLKDDPAI